MTTVAILAALLGAGFGFGVDRLAARWPVHEDGSVRRPDWRTISVTLASAAAFGLLAWRWSEPADLLVLGLYIGALMLLLATDLDQRLLPDLITLPLIVYAAAVTLLGLNPVLAGKTQVLVADGDLSAILAALLAPGLLALSDRIFRGALGMGDLKLAVSLGLMFGLVTAVRRLPGRDRRLRRRGARAGGDAARHVEDRHPLRPGTHRRRRAGRDARRLSGTKPAGSTRRARLRPAPAPPAWRA